jgi:hypothetical protein
VGNNENLQDTRCPGRGSHREAPECESRAYRRANPQAGVTTSAPWGCQGYWRAARTGAHRTLYRCRTRAITLMSNAQKQQPHDHRTCLSCRRPTWRTITAASCIQIDAVCRIRIAFYPLTSSSNEYIEIAARNAPTVVCVRHGKLVSSTSQSVRFEQQ